MLLGNGDGTFRARSPMRWEKPGRNRGGRLQWRRAEPTLSSRTGFGIQMLLGNGDGTFQPRENNRPGDQRYVWWPVISPATGGSIWPSPVAVPKRHGFGVAQQRRRHLRKPRSDYAVGNNPDGIVAGDFNGDGRLDLAVANQGQILFNAGSVSLLLGRGDGTFATPVTDNLNENPMAIVSGDFNGDGHLDLAFTDQDYYAGGIELTYSTSTLLGHGDGTFAARGYGWLSE